MPLSLCGGFRANHGVMSLAHVLVEDCGIEIIYDICDFTSIQMFSDTPLFSVDGIAHQVPKAERKTFALRDSNS